MAEIIRMPCMSDVVAWRKKFATSKDAIAQALLSDFDAVEDSIE